MKSIILLLIFGIVGVLSKTATRYDGYKVYRIIAETEEQRLLLSSLRDGNADIDFWTEIGKNGRPTDIMVSPRSQNNFVKIIRENGLNMHVTMDDVQKNIQVIYPKITQRPIAGQKNEMTWTQYHTLNGIYGWLDELAAANPSVVSTIDLGSSFEGRMIKALKISFKSGRRGVYVEGGIHAREWISPATTTYLINEILNSNDPAFRKIAESFDWYIVPVANPDGYEYSFSSTRLWRKNRTPYSCFGVDMNRNWDVYWGTEGTSTRPCDETYGGPRAFSEAETVVLSEFLKTIGPNLDVYLSFHSYGQYMLMPYGHTTAHLDNYDDVLKVGKAAAKALANRYKTVYTVGNTAEAIYKHSGGTMDWVKQQFQTPIAFTYELRDKGNAGFLLPTNQIIPNCLEVMDSLVALFEEGDEIGLISLS